MAKKTRVDGIMHSFLDASESPRGVRRPPITVRDDVLQGLLRALEQEPVLVIALDKFVELLGVSKAYADPQGVHLLVSSLNRKWRGKVALGQRAKGKFVTVRRVFPSLRER